ncbi:MAG: type II toxin-antitoxin system VapC family toxin [Leptospira sp.]|nr:type II toxin-antitoxin system VapC family toxin [Leptospira sp.]
MPDENSAISEKIYLEMEKGLNVWVPSIWWYELNNVLIVANRRKRISELRMIEIIELFQSMPISIDDNFSFDVFKTVNSIATKHSLSAYDSAYIELAMRKNATLASLDEKLIVAAKKEKVILFK